MTEIQGYNSSLLTIRATSDSYHDKFNDAIAIQKTNASNCQTIGTHLNEDKMLETIGLLSDNRYITSKVGTEIPYNISNFEFDDKDNISSLADITTQLNNVETPCKFVVDFLYGTPFRKLIDLIKDKPKQYVFNSAVDFDPATKLHPKSKNGKEIGLNTPLIEYVDQREGILDVPSGNAVFTCKLDPTSGNDFDNSVLSSHYQLFGSYYRLLLSKGKKDTFAVIVNEEKNVYTFANKTFAAKESGIIKITINKFKSLFTSLKPKFSGKVATPEEGKLFDELSMYVNNIKKGKTNSPEHVIAKRAGDALQAISCLDYGNNAVFVSHDRLAIWLAYYIGVPTIIYMNRGEVKTKTQKKNRITLFQKKALSTPEQQVANMNSEIEKLNKNINNTLSELGLTGVTQESLISVLNANYNSVYAAYSKKITSLIGAITFDGDINEYYRILLSYCLELLPYFKYLESLQSNVDQFNYKPIVGDPNILNNKMVDLSNWKLASKHTEAIKECVVFAKNLPDSIQVGFSTIILTQNAVGTRVSRRTPKQLLKSELFNQTRFDILLDTLSSTQVMTPLIRDFKTKLETRLTSKPDLHIMSKQYVTSMLFFLNEVNSMSGGRAIAAPSSPLGVADTVQSKSPLTEHIGKSVGTSRKVVNDFNRDSLATRSKDVLGKGPLKETKSQTFEPQEESGVGIKTRFGATYYPNKDVLLDDIFMKDTFGLVLRLASLDSNVISAIRKVINIDPLMNDVFIETITTKMDSFINIFNNGETQENNKNNSTSAQSKGGRRKKSQHGGVGEDITMVNYVNDTVFLYELDTLITALENVNIDSESQHGYSDAGAAASGAGDTIASMKTLDDETVISTIYNLYDDDDIVIITDQISRIAQNVVAVNVVSSRATEDYSDIILENDAIIQLITMLDSANGDERTRRVNLRNIFRKVQEIGNDELISYYNYPIRSMVTTPRTFVEGIHLMYQKIVEIYGAIGAPVMPSKGGSMSRKLRRKSRTTRRNKRKRNKSHHKKSRRNIRKHKQTKRKHRKSKQNKKK